MTKKRTGSLIFLAVGIYGFIFSMQIPMGTWSEPGGGVFPLIVSILLCISGGVMFLTGGGKVEIDWRAMVKEQWTPLRIVLLTAGFILVLNPLGYLITSSLYLFSLLFWISRYKVWTAAGLSIAVGTVSWYIFDKLLAVQLPKGLL